MRLSTAWKCVLAVAVTSLVACGRPGTTSAIPLDDPAIAPNAAPKMLFDDEFDGTALDRVWSTCYPWSQPAAGCTNNPSLELEWYVRPNVTVSGGYLALTAKAQRAHGHPYTSGMISTGGTPSRSPSFSYLYGYAESRIELPRGTGMWPAFWLVPADYSWPPEIDIMEWQGVAPKDDIVTIHWGSAKHPLQSSSAVNTKTPLWSGYHVYGLDWEPSRVVWYFDGKPIKTYANAAHIPHKPMYVILNLAIGGWEAGQLHPKPSSFPATMSVDYVRIWNKKP
ncbi:MAG: glycoside hydrolase family 16 protein [Candidatus Eremiobacteraeota bacterium]|nr:glycoside hydrolase family 16 protein [Candidatus Eremiobacteraeota bacterium]